MNPKFKSEHYVQMGGLNTKFSFYAKGMMEFLKLTNFDFQNTGALTSRDGTLQAIGQTFPNGVNSLVQYTKLDGSSYIVASYSGGISAGATLGLMPGLSLINMATFAAAGGSLRPVFEDIQLLAIAGIFPVEIETPYNGNWNQKFVTQVNPSTFINYYVAANTTLSAQNSGANKLNYAIFQDYLWAADGQKFFKYSGTTTSKVGVPPLVTLKSATLPFIGVTNPVAGNTIAIGIAVTTGSFSFYGSWVNERNVEGPIWPITCLNMMTSGVSTLPTALSGSFLAMQMAFVAPANYNLKSINIYSYFSQSVTFSLGATANWSFPYSFFNSYDISSLSSTFQFGNTITLLQIGTTYGGQTTLFGNVGALPSSLQNTYLPLGFTLQNTSQTYPYYTVNGINAISMNNFSPSILEVFGNRMMMAGFSSMPSQVVFSEDGEPEQIDPTFNFEVRTNDGDRITAMKSYNSKLLIFKRKSFYILSGDNPNNFFLQLVSDQYGTQNNRCVVIYDQKVLFLDEKGIIEFNGSNLTVISLPIQPLFIQHGPSHGDGFENYSSMFHDKKRSQIMITLISSPASSPTVDNDSITLVYDYIVKAWTTHEGYNPRCWAYIDINNDPLNRVRTLCEGDSDGYIKYFFQNSNGQDIRKGSQFSITCQIQSNFDHEIGNSFTKQYRRFYLNAEGITTAEMVFYKDLQSLVSLTAAIGFSNQIAKRQARIDFGIPAQNLSFQLTAIVIPALSKITVYGFTIEQRLQRKV